MPPGQAWSLSALAEEVGLAADVVQKKMMLWVNQGIVAEVPGPGYRLVKDQVKLRPRAEDCESEWEFSGDWIALERCRPRCVVVV